MFFHKKAPHTPGCMVVHLLVALLLFLGSVASLVGVYKSHVMPEGLTFGTTSGSLALLAFAVTITLFLKQVKNCFMKCEVCKP